MGNYGYQKKYFGIFDRQLDNYKNGPMWLMKEEIASVVKEAIHLRDGKEYDLIAYTIMPNHVHLVITPITSNNVSRSEASTNTQTNQKLYNEANASFYVLTKILQDLKSKTALKCNKLLNRHGAFWHHESYDHVVRNIEELRRIVNYVLLNPVKATLVDNYEKWKWNYYNPKYLI